MNIDSGKQEPTHGFTEICSLPAFLCLFIKMLHCALVGNCTVVEIRSLVLARDDGVGALCCGFVDVHF